MIIRKAEADELPEIIGLLKTREWDDSNTLDRDTWFVAHDDGVVGCVQIVEVEPGHSVIDQVLVHEDRRELTIGRQMLQAALANVPGAKYLCCHEELLRFYGHFGFENVGYENTPPSIQAYWVLIDDYPTDDGHIHFYLRAPANPPAG